MSLTAKEKTNKQQRHGLKAIKKKKENFSYFVL